MKRMPIVFGAAALGATMLVSGGAYATATPVAAAATIHWVDEPVTFAADGMTIFGTYRHPVGSFRARPAALLIAGSGPTDRDGNNPLLPGQVDTLRWLADTLSDDGVASLRYDKLGTGQTGLGPFQNDPAAVGAAPFEDEARAALRFLADRPGVDRHRLMAIGHSEGALWALQLANQVAHTATPIHSLGLLEPLPNRFLTLISEQLTRNIRAEEQTGAITAARADADLAALATIIASLRATGTLPADVPADLRVLFNPGTVKFEAETDRLDPARLARTLPVPTSVLLSCSDADIQIGCADVDHLAGGLRQPAHDVDYLHQTGIDHVLKVDNSRTVAHYGDPLPFSPQLRQTLHRFVDRHPRG